MIELQTQNDPQTVASEIPIVFLHGAGLDQTVFASQVSFFGSRGFVGWTPDYPGRGAAPEELLEGIEQHADWVAGWIGERTDEPVNIVGHSMGSLIGLSLAARHPEMVNRLVLLNTAKRMAVHPDLLSSSKAGTRLCLDLLDEWEQVGDGALNRGLRERVGFKALHSDLSACDGFVSGTQPSRVVAPTLVVAGDGDKMTRVDQGKRVADEILGAKMVVLEGAGHSMMKVQAMVVNELLLEFLTGHGENDE